MLRHFRRRRRAAAAMLGTAALLALMAAMDRRSGQARSVAVTSDAAEPAPGAAARGGATAPPLRVCADPNNLPFSNERGEGFENRIAALLAAEMGRPLAYEWRAQRRGFIRNSLNANRCDVIVGIPTSVDMVLTTRPYYRSTYVFVTKRGAQPVASFDDPRLRTMRIGVQLIGDDGANSPPVHALTTRGIVGNLVGYTVYGDYREPNPPARVVEAVAQGDVDVAIAWGPLAGWVARTSSAPLALTPVSPQIDVPFLPFVFDVGMGVRRVDVALRDTLDAILVRRRASIDSILACYGVPRLNRRATAGAPPARCQGVPAAVPAGPASRPRTPRP